MEISTLVLINYSVLDENITKSKFLFKLNHYSKVTRNRLSRNFYFAGHRWKLQIRKQNGYFGIFLRWFGTERKNQNRLNLQCTASLKFSVLNRFVPEISVSEGKKNEADIFKRLGGGVGYGKIISLEELEQTPGFMVCDALCVQLFIHFRKTTFEDELMCDSLEVDEKFVRGRQFVFYGATWSIILYPNGENEVIENAKNDGEHDDEHASIYLKRENETNDLIRHDVQFSFASTIGAEFTIEQHYYGKTNNIFGSASFIPIKELKDRRENQSNLLKITVEFLKMVPYYYFTYKTEEQEKKRSFKDDFRMCDYFSVPWNFTFVENAQNENISGVLKVDGASSRVKNWTSGRRAIQTSWNLKILNLSDISKSITLAARKKRAIRDSVFEMLDASDTVEIPVTPRRLFRKESNFLDDKAQLSVRISILCCNTVSIVNQEETTRAYQEMCEYHETHQKEFLQHSIEENTIQSEDGAGRDDDTNILIQSLHDHVDAYERYIKDLEKRPRVAKEIHDERSIKKLKTKCRPSFSDHKNLTLLTKQIERIIQTLPLKFAKVVYAGALAEGTIVANHLQIDYILHMKNYKKHKNNLRTILNLIKERIREHSSKNPSDTSIERTSSSMALPYTHRFYCTHKGLLFTTGMVNVTMLLSRSTDIFPTDAVFFKKSSNAGRNILSKYITLSAEKQVKFIDEQTDRCKDLICIVKCWSDGVKWKKAGNRPSSYLISLLVIHAYEKAGRKPVAKTPSFDKEVMLELALSVHDTKLRIEWNKFYKAKTYPLEKETYPLIRDPALPYHNVCETGISDWKQFRDEMDEWVTRLTF